MHPENTPNDQAQLLRQLAQPASLADQSPAQSKMEKRAKTIGDSDQTSRKISDGPQVVLVSELPSLQGGLALAFQLAHRLSQKHAPALLVDLAPSASRLPSVIENCPLFPDAVSARIRPFWTTSHYGRSLADWTDAQQHDLCIVAQPAGDFPTAEQLPRICEQLIRLIGNPRTAEAKTNDLPYRQVVFMSECIGLPLDSVCWQSADTILLLHDTSADATQIEAVIAARFPAGAREQRIVLLRKQVSTLRHWASRRRVEQRDDQPSRQLSHIPGVECWDIVWPDVHSRLSRSMPATVAELLDEVITDKAIRSGRSRQAS